MQVQFQDGLECSAIKELYNLLKDHKNPYMQDLVTASYQHSYREEMSNALGIPGIAEMVSQELENRGAENVVRVTLINPSFQPSLTNAMTKMIEARLHVDQFGFNVPNPAVPASGCDEKRLSDKLTILVNDITIAMKKLEYARYRGKLSLQKGSEVNVHLLVQVRGKSVCEQSRDQRTFQIQTRTRYEKGDRSVIIL